MNAGQRSLGLYERLHMRHRRWRYRYKSERPSIELLQSLGLEGKTLIDAGANWGVYSWIMSDVAGPSGAVHAFEPQPELFDHLRCLQESFGLRNYTVNGKGLSSTPATLTLQRPGVGSGEAGVNLPDGTFKNSIEVDVVTLDDYMQSRGERVAFIKADVQGHEFDVFQGAQRVLERDAPVLLFELFDYEADDGKLPELMDQLGYRGWFYHVEADDHARLTRNGHGTYVEFERRKAFSHPKPGLDFRNYFFAHRDSETARELTAASGKARKSAAL